MQVAEVPLLVLCGAPGTGKSSVAWEIYWLVAALWRVYSDTGASALVVSGLRRLQSDVLACAAAVTAEEHRKRILTRANTRYGVERGSSYEPALAP
jgi:predicted kinase